MVEDVQVLPNGYYIFRFQARKMALDVLGAGQWMFRNTPFCFFSWSKEFSSNGPKSTKCPVWIELPDLPYHFYQWTDKIASSIGKVLGSKKRTLINPSWHPQVLVEIDMALPLVEEIFINCGEYSLTQKVLYKHMPNACFHCGRKGHVMKECPLKVTNKSNPQSENAAPNNLSEKKDKTELGTAVDKGKAELVEQPKKKVGEDKKAKEFTPTSKKKAFKQKKSHGDKVKANFYSLLEKPALSEDDEDILEFIPETQLDGNRLAQEVNDMDDNAEEALPMHEIDDTPLSTAQEHTHEENVTSEQDIEMENLKELKRVHIQVGSPTKGTHNRNRRQKK
ncbi:hypothetical protein L7F22_026879 [Adiantum nelumboides]|nr:hypothetical protein [Adiantum nelumboides]